MRRNIVKITEKFWGYVRYDCLRSSDNLRREMASHRGALSRGAFSKIYNTRCSGCRRVAELKVRQIPSNTTQDSVIGNQMNSLVFNSKKSFMYASIHILAYKVYIGASVSLERSTGC